VKFVATIKAPARFLNREDAIEYVGSVKLFADMEQAGWFRPVVQRTRFVLYDRAVLDAACDKVSQGEYPGALT